MLSIRETKMIKTLTPCFTKLNYLENSRAAITDLWDRIVKKQDNQLSSQSRQIEKYMQKHYIHETPLIIKKISNKKLNKKFQLNNVSLGELNFFFFSFEKDL